MKLSLSYLVTGLMLILLINGSFVSAQNFESPRQPMGKRPLMIPELTEQQQKQIRELNLAHMKEIQPLRNEMRELMARYRTLSTAEKPSMTEINKNIDARTALTSRIMKANAAHQQEIRKILTDEQRLFFDTRSHRGRTIQDRRDRFAPDSEIMPGNRPGRIPGL